MQPWEPVLPKGHAAKTRMLKSMLSQWPAVGAYPVPAFVMPPQPPSSLSPPPQPVREAGDKKKRKEWVCKCKTSNWESHSSCRDCGKERPTPCASAASKRQDPSRERRPAKNAMCPPPLASLVPKRPSAQELRRHGHRIHGLRGKSMGWHAMKAEVVRLQGVILTLKSHNLSVDEAAQKLQKLCVLKCQRSKGCSLRKLKSSGRPSVARRWSPNAANCKRSFVLFSSRSRRLAPRNVLCRWNTTMR